MSHHPIHHDGGGADGRTDVRMPRGDLALLIAMAAFALVTFLPFTRGIEFGGVSLVAWNMLFLIIAAPAAGLALAVRDGGE